MKINKIKTKEELLKNANESYKAFLRIINSLPPESRYHDINTNKRDKNIRDLCAQIVGWQNYLMGWYEEGMKDRLPDIPAKGYTWKIADALEMKIWQRFQKTSLDDCLILLEETHEQAIKAIEKSTEQELFEKKYHRWTLNKTMAYYFIQFAYIIYVKKINAISKVIKKLKLSTIEVEDEVIDKEKDNLKEINTELSHSKETIEVAEPTIDEEAALESETNEGQDEINIVNQEKEEEESLDDAPKEV
ncbi:ClbS/DfsB family four-helix bundle protein [Acholeplasma sp. OttesenSCG-928-E16]|nr:ClbS/DfsB family four-helix bundle protein [Acholeplasma sp. OttesenSCG-928-E16]